MSILGIVGTYTPLADTKLDKTDSRSTSASLFSEVLAETELESELSIEDAAEVGAADDGAIDETEASDEISPSEEEASSTGGTGGTGSAVPTESEVADQIETAASSGKISDTQIALLLLCMMMQGGDGSADMSPLYVAMAALMGNLGDGDTSELYQAMISSGFSGSVLSSVSANVFGSYFTTPDVSSTGSAIVPTEAWKPTTPAVTSDADDRSASLLRSVIDQFNVETAERYRPYRNGNDTYCNIFTWDVTAALGCEIPHYVDSSGNPKTYPDVSGAYELDANGTCDWLSKYGSQYGWREVSAEEAQAAANSGLPTVAGFKNTGGIGHVQIVCPSENGSYDPIRGVTVAQAGSNRYNYAYASSVYSSSRLPSVRYYVHD